MNPIVRMIILSKLKGIEKNIKEGKMKGKGVFTSEFWVSLVVMIITAFSNQIGLDPEIRDGILKIVIAYVGSRTVVKVADVVKSEK